MWLMVNARVRLTGDLVKVQVTGPVSAQIECSQVIHHVQTECDYGI